MINSMVCKTLCHNTWGYVPRAKIPVVRCLISSSPQACWQSGDQPRDGTWPISKWWSTIQPLVSSTRRNYAACRDGGGGVKPPFPKHPTSGVSRKGTRGKPRGGAARGSDSSTTVAESAPPPLAAGSGATTTRSDRRRWHNKTMATRDCGRGRWLVARAGDRAGVGEAGASHANAAGGGGGGGQSSARRRG